MKSHLWILLLIFAIFFMGCTSYKKPPTPSPKTEVRPPKPHEDAKWKSGYWKWKGQTVGYVWVPGRWKI